MKKDSKTIKEKLAELFMLVKKESFLDAKAQDGSILRTADEAFKTGSQVVLISEDGTSAPAPDSSYVLEDGSTLVIKSGVVETITPASPDATATQPADATGANPTTDAPAAMDAAPAPTPTEGTPAPQADSADGSDMDSLISIIQNLTDRVSALEAELSSTKMSVTKMSAAPAAAAFNTNASAKGTIGDYLDNFRKEHKAKQDEAKDKMLKLQAELGKRTKPQAQEFSKSSNQTSAPIKNNNKKFDLGLGNSFSISKG